MKACKHLDHNEATYGETCTLVTLDSFKTQVKYWQRKEVPYEGAPVNVQFCGQGRGRINGIFECYNGELGCYEPTDSQ